MRLIRPQDRGTHGRAPVPSWDQWDDQAWRNSPARGWCPSLLDSVSLACGCRVLPWPVIRRPKVSEALCDKHGWQPITPHKTVQRKYQRIPSEFGYQTRIV